MDVISGIASALALGAAAGLKDTAEIAIKEGYNALKNLISLKLPAILPSLVQLEQVPESKARRAVVVEELERVQASDDEEILKLAEELLDRVAETAPRLAETVGVSLTDIKGASLSIADIRSSGSGVMIDRAEIEGDISISGVSAGVKDPSHPKG
jgi:hypothetical protein